MSLTIEPEPLGRQYRRHVVGRTAGLAGLALAVAISFLLDIAIGPSNLSLSEVLGALIAPGEVPRGTEVIVWAIRLPTAAMALVVGAALGLAGAELQTVLNKKRIKGFRGARARERRLRGGRRAT